MAANRSRVEGAADDGRVDIGAGIDMRVRIDWIAIGGRWRIGRAAQCAVAAIAFAFGPAIVFASVLHFVDLFPDAAAHIAHVEIVAARAHGEPEGIAQPQCVDLAARVTAKRDEFHATQPRPRRRIEGIAGCAVAAPDPFAGQDAQDLAVEIVIGGGEAGDTAFAGRNVEIAVLAEVQIAGVVIADAGDDAVDQRDLRCRIDSIAGHGEARDAIARPDEPRQVGMIVVRTGCALCGLAGVIEIEVAIGCEVGVERDAEQTTLAVTADVQRQGSLRQQLAVLEDAHAGHVLVVAASGAALENQDAAVRRKGRRTRGEQPRHDALIGKAGRQ